MSSNNDDILNDVLNSMNGDKDDPNRSLSPDEIAALFAQAGVGDEPTAETDEKEEVADLDSSSDAAETDELEVDLEEALEEIEIDLDDPDSLDLLLGLREVPHREVPMPDENEESNEENAEPESEAVEEDNLGDISETLQEDDVEQSVEDAIAAAQQSDDGFLEPKFTEADDLTNILDSMSDDDDNLKEIGDLLKKSDNHELVEDDVMSLLDEEDQIDESGNRINVNSEDEESVAEEESEESSKDKKKKKEKKGGLFSKLKKKKSDEDMADSVDADEADADELIASATAISDSEPLDDLLAMGTDMDVTADLGSLLSGDDAARPEQDQFAGEEREVSMEEVSDVLPDKKDRSEKSAGKSASTVAEESDGDDVKASGKKKKDKKKKEKDPNKKNALSSFFAMLLEEEEEEEESPEELEKKKAKKAKKKKGKGKVTDADDNEGIMEELDAEETKKKKVKTKKKKADKPKKEKKPKKEAEPEEKSKKLPIKMIIRIFVLCFSIMALLLLVVNLIPNMLSMKTAKDAFYKQEFDVTYREMHGKKLSESEERIYQKSKLITQIQQKFDSYLNFKQMNLPVEALHSLLSGYAFWAEKTPEIGEYNAVSETGAIKDKILDELSNEYDISEDEAVEINNLSNYEYTKRLEEITGALSSVNSNKVNPEDAIVPLPGAEGIDEPEQEPAKAEETEENKTIKDPLLEEERE